jgi:hypothetical protein
MDRCSFNKLLAGAVGTVGSANSNRSGMELHGTESQSTTDSSIMTGPK